MAVRVRVAIPTKAPGGLRGEVDEVFSRAPVFTIVDLKDGEPGNVTVVENAAASYSHGAGPVSVKILADHHVEFLFAPEIGVGSSTLLEELGIRYVKVEKGAKVSKLLRELKKESKSERQAIITESK
jgi:predicted Fe-Mo cluster-binding NifX family protein